MCVLAGRGEGDWERDLERERNLCCAREGDRDRRLEGERARDRSIRRIRRFSTRFLSCFCAVHPAFGGIRFHPLHINGVSVTHLMRRCQL